MLFRSLSWHDDQTALFGVGTTYEIGRWMLGLLGDVVRCVFGESNYSLPVYSGMMAILFIAVAVFLLITMYHIKSALSIVAISGVMVCIPVITGLFGYMFTAPYYMFGMLLSIAGCFLIHNYAEKGKLCGGGICFSWQHIYCLWDRNISGKFSCFCNNSFIEFICVSN